MPDQHTAESCDHEVWTLTEAAQFLRLHPVTARNLANTGDLPGMLPKIGRRHRFSRSALMAYAAGVPSEVPAA